MNWHWDTYHFCCPKAPSSDLYFWGVTSMPSVQARLVELSKDFGLKTDDESGNSSAGDESSNSFSLYRSSSPKVVVGVESFGAIRDNATLCTASINAAISHVAAAPGGGTVRLSRGSYLSGRVELHVSRGKSAGKTDDSTMIMRPDVPSRAASLRTLVVQKGAAAGKGRFSSIQTALDASRPGDTILVKNGTYRESPTFTRSGVRGLPISLVAFAGHQPCVVPNATYEHGVVLRAAWIIVDGLEIRDGYNGVIVYGPNPKTAGSNAVHSTIRNCHIHNNGDHSPPSLPTGQGILVVSVRELAIEGNIIERNGLRGADPFQVSHGRVGHR
jgi:hypothetical protein